MFRKIFIVILTLVALPILVSCGSSDPVSLDGRWVSNETPKFEAVIDNGTIVIEGGDMLYWKGSAPEKLEDGQSFTSEGDSEAMSASILGSSETTKTFAYSDDKLSFEGSAMGQDFEVDLVRE